MSYENVKAEVRDGILYVTIDRPKVLNALNGQTVEEIYKVFAEGRDDASVKAVILTGGGEKAFVAGADINELAKMTPMSGKATASKGQAVFFEIESPTRAPCSSKADFACSRMRVAYSAMISFKSASLGSAFSSFFIR